MVSLVDYVEEDAAAARALVDELTPVIQARAARALLRNRAHREQRRALKQEIDELTQEVLATLFAHNASVLRSWDPARGTSLRTFVALVAEREISDVLQSGRRRPFSEAQAVDPEDDASGGVSRSPERQVEARELVERVYARLRQDLSPQGLQLFQLLLVDDCSVEEVCAETGLRRDAVYAWRSRLCKVVRRCADELSA